MLRLLCGSILIGLTGPGYAPLADGPWEGALTVDPVSGAAVLTGAFAGSYVSYPSYLQVEWDGTFTATR
jgi:hypothetical protein